MHQGCCWLLVVLLSALCRQRTGPRCAGRGWRAVLCSAHTNTRPGTNTRPPAVCVRPMPMPIPNTLLPPHAPPLPNSGSVRRTASSHRPVRRTASSHRPVWCRPRLRRCRVCCLHQAAEDHVTHPVRRRLRAVHGVRAKYRAFSKTLPPLVFGHVSVFVAPLLCYSLCLCCATRYSSVFFGATPLHGYCRGLATRITPLHAGVQSRSFACRGTVALLCMSGYSRAPLHAGVADSVLRPSPLLCMPG